MLWFCLICPGFFSLCLPQLPALSHTQWPPCPYPPALLSVNPHTHRQTHSAQLIICYSLLFATNHAPCPAAAHVAHQPMYFNTPKTFPHCQYVSLDFTVYASVSRQTYASLPLEQNFLFPVILVTLNYCSPVYFTHPFFLILVISCWLSTICILFLPSEDLIKLITLLKRIPRVLYLGPILLHMTKSLLTVVTQREEKCNRNTQIKINQGK